MANRFTDPLPQFLDANGDPYAGGSLEFYESGTSTPLATYSDQALTTPNSNPLDLNSAGRPASPIFLKAENYKVLLKDSGGNTVWSEDPVTSAPATTSDSITYTGNFTGASAVNLRDELDRRAVSLATFSSVQAGIDAVHAAGGGTLLVPAGTHTFTDTDADGYGLVLKSNVTIRGVSRGGSVLKAGDDSADYDAHIRIAPGATNVTIEHLTIDLNAAGQSGNAGDGGLVGSDNCDDVTVRDVTFINPADDKRVLVTNLDADTSDIVPQNPATNWFISGVKVEGGQGKCIQVRKTIGAVVSDCSVTTNVTDPDSESDSAFETSHSQRVSWTNCHAVHDASDWGPTCRVVNASRYVTYTGCTGKGGRQILFCTDSKHVKFVGCTGYENDSDGILVQAANGDNNAGWGEVDDIKVLGCTVINPNGRGFVSNIVSNGSFVRRVTIADCTFWSDDGNMSHGIENEGNTTGGGGGVNIVQYDNEVLGATGARFEGDLDGPPDFQAQSVRSGSIIDLADDSAVSIPVPVGADTGFFRLITRTVQDFAVEIGFRADSTPTLGGECWNLNSGRMDTTTGSLSGTTGTDTNITVSVGDGVIWVENRSGFTRDFDYLFTCVS